MTLICLQISSGDKVKVEELIYILTFLGLFPYIHV